MTIRRTFVAAAWSLAVVVFLASASLAQTTTGTVAGTVRDEQGAVIPGATVVLTNEARGTKTTPVVTNATGDFVVVNVPADRYTVEITMPSFKTMRRSGVDVSAGERVSLGSVVLAVGGTAEVVNVTAETPLIQASSGERSFSVQTESVESLPLSTRNFTALASLAPGVSGTSRIGDNAGTNFTMDGVSTMDTGSNRLMMNVNVESIAEVKVLTSGYQAEYGRSSGAQISAVTKSGTNRLKGSLYDVERNSDWNANSKTNILNAVGKTVSKQRDWGFSLGGPVGKPGGSNKLFFYYTQEFNPRTAGGVVTDYRMPTALERQGDFSKTYDNNGALYPYIKDPSKAGTCSAASTAACFNDGGVLGKIPASRLYQPGVNILNMFPLPNVDGTGIAYNYETVSPNQSLTGWQPAIRVDYQPTSSLRGTVKYAAYGQSDKIIQGSIPGFNDTQQQHPIVATLAVTMNYTMNASTFLEVTWGRTTNEEAGCALQGGSPSFCTSAFQMNATSNRNNIGLDSLPFLYPNANVIDPRYYAYKVLNQVAPPIWDGTQVLLPPSFTWGSRVANTPPNLGYPGFVNTNVGQDFAASVTKVAGSHTMKGGFYLTHSFKAQQPTNNNSFGALNFQQDTVGTNQFDTSFGFSNAIVGSFSSYAQTTKYTEGDWVYNNIEGYVQDNWKVRRGLTLDYGVRFVHQQPQYDQLLQTSNFLFGSWKQSAAPVLYVAGCANGVYPCSSGAAAANRQAMNPATGQFAGANSTILIGTVVPNTGDSNNGLFLAGQGIAKTDYTWPKLDVAPRFGAAYDLTGEQKIVIRGGGGVFYDRPSGNSVFPMGSNPPTSGTQTIRFSQLQSLGKSGFSPSAAPALNIWEYAGELPSSLQWNAGVQLALPFATALDVSYVGQHGYHLVQAFPLNAIDFGTALQPQYIDKTQSTANTPVSTDLMRPIQGYGTIGQSQDVGWNTYHSLQFSFNRRFVHGLSFGFNDTIGLASSGSSAPRLQHNADGSYSIRADQGQANALLGASTPVRHTMKANFVWDLPDVHADSGMGRVAGLLLNDWQLSGIWTAATGGTYTVGVNYSGNSSPNVNITGSPDYAGRVVLIGSPGAGCGSNIYQQFNTAAFAGPPIGSVGLESGNDYLSGCFSSALDLSLARSINLGHGRTVQLRADIFNAPNQAIISGRQTTMQLASVSAADVTNIVNLPYDASGNLIANKSLPKNAGFGVANAYQAARTVQLQVRFGF